MPKNILYIIVLMLFMPKSIMLAQPSIQWNVAANIMNGNKPSIGYAGMISGVNNDVLIVAGGANFPDALPWQGGKKFYSDKIYVLEKSGKNHLWNEKNDVALPQPIAYSGSSATDKGVLYVGGDNEKGISAKAGLLKWNAAKQKVEIKDLPDLPVAITSPAVTANGNKVYVICGDEAKNSSSKFFCIDLSDKNPSWKSFPDAPLALANGMAVFQNNKLYLIGGRTKTTTGISDLRTTTFAFDFKKNKWQQLADIFDGEKTTPFTAGAAFAVGKKCIVLAGGDKGDVFHQIETLIAKANASATDEEKQKFIKEKNILVEHHQGFSTDVLLYNTKKDKWKKIGALPVAAQVTTSAAKWGNDLVISSGEIRPGVRSPKILVGKVKK